MTTIAIYCVTYHSYESLTTYLQSVATALEGLNDRVELHVHIADNSTHSIQPISAPEGLGHCGVLATHENLGYFGAVRRLMEIHDPAAYDYAIISNVDLTMDSDYLKHLADSRYPANAGWIAPRIHSQLEHRDRNPQILKRYTKRQLELLRIKVSLPLLHYVYNRTFYRRKKRIKCLPGTYYAGHGSFIVLTKEYFRRCGIINYPIFLFDEEIYLAEQCHKAKLTVIYDPASGVVDSEHVSTGKMPLGTYCRYNREALSYILREFY